MDATTIYDVKNLGVSENLTNFADYLKQLLNGKEIIIRR